MKELFTKDRLIWIVIFLIISIILTFSLINSPSRGGFMDFSSLAIVGVWVAFITTSVIFFSLEKESKKDKDIIQNAVISIVLGGATFMIAPFLMLMALSYLGILLKIIGIDY